MEYFSYQRIFLFCGVCRVFIYLINIPTIRYYVWGVNSHSIGKWTAKVQKWLFWSFFFIIIVRILVVLLLSYLFVWLSEISCHAWCLSTILASSLNQITGLNPPVQIWGSLEFWVRSLVLCCHCHLLMQTPLICVISMVCCQISNYHTL